MLDDLRRCALVLFVLLGSGTVGPVSAQVLWTEGAENGLTNIIDGTDASYSLIQSDVFTEGSNAFHLANPGFQDNFFTLDQSITIQPNTDLFFMSQLRAATSSQLARVQLSTNGGTTFPNELFSQAGTGFFGEGSFRLQQVDLSAFASQTVQFRFYYDFIGGSAFTQTSSNTGWFVDNIQIADQFQKTQYTVGDPTPHEQQYLEYINRARADALVEATRLRNETHPDIVSAYSFFGIDPADIETQFGWYVANGHIAQNAQPLSFNENLLQAAQLHSQDMFNNQFQGHVSSNNPPAPFQPGFTLGQRLDAVGYSSGAGENVFSSAELVQQGHAAFEVDWGDITDTSDPAYNPAFAGQGMQNPAGHRLNIHNPDFKEAGIGVINGTNGSVGPQVVTQDLGDPGNATFVTGVVYEDLNDNNFYDIDEGRSGVRIDVDGSPFFAISSTSGAYSVPITGDGVHDVMFSGGGTTFSTTATVTNGLNVKVDYLVTLISLVLGDADNSGTVTANDLIAVQQNFGNVGPNGDGTDLGDANDDGVVTANDLIAVQQNFGNTLGPLGSAVPEPGTIGLLIVMLATLRHRKWVV